jgi:hypothetical protein
VSKPNPLPNPKPGTFAATLSPSPPLELAGGQTKSSEFAELQRAKPNQLRLQWVLKVKPISARPLIGPASDPPHPQGPLLKNNPLSHSSLLVPARNELPRGIECEQMEAVALKGRCHEIFDFWFFFMNQFPPSP